MMFPYDPPYSLQTLNDWCELHRPNQIGMTDKQYAWLGNLMCANVLSVNGVPIVFLEGAHNTQKNER